MTKSMTIEWRLLVVMAEKKIRTISELRRRLAAIDIDISSQQLCKVANDLPDRLNTKLLAGLLTVLNCRVDELMRVDGTVAPSSPGNSPLPAAADADYAAEEPKKKPRRRPPPRENSAATDLAVGPKVRPFPKKPAK